MSPEDAHAVAEPRLSTPEEAAARLYPHPGPPIGSVASQTLYAHRLRAEDAIRARDREILTIVDAAAAKHEARAGGSSAVGLIAGGAYGALRDLAAALRGQP